MSKKAHSSANLKMPDRNASINRTFSSMGDSSLQGMATSTQWHAPCKSVTHQPGLICYPSTRTVPARPPTTNARPPRRQGPTTKHPPRRYPPRPLDELRNGSPRPMDNLHLGGIGRFPTRSKDAATPLDVAGGVESIVKQADPPGELGGRGGGGGGSRK